MSDFGTWFGFLELPFLFTAVFFAFRTARALRGGALARGMNLMAWGFLVMGIGHLHMEVDRTLHYNVLANVFGSWAGAIVCADEEPGRDSGSRATRLGGVT